MTPFSLPPPGRRRKALEQRLRDRVATLVKGVEGGGVVDPGALEEAESLRRLVELQSALPGRRRRWVIGVAGALALALGLLLLRRVETVEVVGVVRASAVQLAVQGEPILPLDKPLRWLAAHGYTPLRDFPADSGEAIPSSLVAEALPGGTLTLQQVTLPRTARLSIERIDPERTRLRVEQGDSGGFARVNARGPARVFLGRDTLLLGAGTDHAFLLEFGTKTFDLSFSPAGSSGEIFAGVRGRSIDFAESWELVESARSSVALLSTIEGGELVLPEMGGERVTLSASEHLHLRPRSLRIHRLRSGPEGITVEFRARTSELAVGDGEARRDLRPSLLEWYAANRRLELARTAYVSGLGMLLAILYWWKERR